MAEITSPSPANHHAVAVDSTTRARSCSLRLVPRSSPFGCTRLVRLLEDLVNARLEHLAELLVEGIAKGAAGAGGTGRLRGGVRAGVAGLGRRRGGRRIAFARGAFPVHRGAGAAAALARRRLLRTLRVREACDELASDFACDFPLLPEEVELDFSSSRFARVPVDGLTGSAASSLALSPRLQRLLSLGVLDSNEGLELLEDREERRTHPRGRDCPPSRRGWPQRRRQARRSGAYACRSSSPWPPAQSLPVAA